MIKIWKGFHWIDLRLTWLQSELKKKIFSLFVSTSRWVKISSNKSLLPLRRLYKHPFLCGSMQISKCLFMEADFSLSLSLHEHTFLMFGFSLGSKSIWHYLYFCISLSVFLSLSLFYLFFDSSSHFFSLKMMNTPWFYFIGYYLSKYCLQPSLF